MESLTDSTLKTLPKTSILQATTDVALLMDGKGKIIDVMVVADELNDTINESWKGRLWGDTVSKESQQKIEEMLSKEQDPEAQQWRQVNHPTKPGTTDLPVRYRTFKLANNKFLGLGRDLTPIANLQQQLISAQQAAEQDYWQLRQAESKYRLLFQNALEAVLVVDAETGVILEANPAAISLMNWSHAPDNRKLWSIFASKSEASVRELIASSAANGRAKSADLTIKDAEHTLTATAALLRQGNAAIHIVHLRHSDGSDGQKLLAFRNSQHALPGFFDAMPDAFVITDSAGTIEYANRSFSDLAQLANKEQATGEPLSNWLGRANVDLNVLLNNLEQTGRVRFFQTELTSDHDMKSDAEISAAKLNHDSGKSAFGFVIRQASQRPSSANSEIVSNRSAEELTDLVGRVPLKELVKESAEVIERLSIEAALQLTQNNRAAAAEMLGLSRQSLYVKMRLYDIADKQHTDS